MEYTIRLYEERDQKAIYDLCMDFQQEEKLYKEWDYEGFKRFLFGNPQFQPQGSFVAEANGSIIGFASAINRACDEGNEKASGYTHTFVVKKEYRRQGIGSALLAKIEGYIGSARNFSRMVFLSPINWPWIIPHTDHHLHPGMPAVIFNSDYYLFLLHHGYVVYSIHDGFHLPLSNYVFPEKVQRQAAENAKSGLVVELYDPKKHYGLEDFYEAIKDNQGFVNSIKHNLERETPYPFVVASDNGKVCGWTGAVYTEPTGRGHLDGIAVDPAYRGRGLGNNVLAKLCQESMKNGASYMTLFTGIDNNARYMYLGAGFQVALSFADMRKVLHKVDKK